MATNPYSIEANNIQSLHDKLIQTYNTAEQKQLEQQRAQNQQTINNLKAEEPKINDQFKTSANQAYVNKMIQQRDLPQRMAALGLTGGASETSQLRLNTMYGNNMNDLTKQRDSSLNDLNLRIANANAEGDAALAAISNNFALQRAQAQAELEERLAEAELQRQLWEAEQAAKAEAAAAAARSRSSSSSGSKKSSGNNNSAPSGTATKSDQYTYKEQYDYDMYLAKHGSGKAQAGAIERLRKAGVSI